MTKICLKDFVIKAEDFASIRKGKRQYLSDAIQREFFNRLNAHFKSKVEVPRMRVGNRQEIETLTNEEALLLAKYLRNEKKDWVPRVSIPK